MVPQHQEYVSEYDVLADIAISTSTAANLRTTNAILLAALLLASYILNIILITTIYTSKKLRATLVYIIFAHISTVNLLTLSLSILLSLLFVANGAWIFGDAWCRVNAMVQEFCLFYTLLLLMLAAVERAVGLSFESLPSQRPNELCTFFTLKRVLVLMFLLAVVSLAVNIPSGTGMIPVRPFRNRYVCAVGSGAPLGYTLTRVVLYIGCLLVLLMFYEWELSVITVIFVTHVHPYPHLFVEGNSLPQQSHDYSDFIRKNRARQEHLSRAKLVVLLVCIFILVSGPYVSLNFTYEICNSLEFLLDDTLLEIPQDADTLITWLMFLFPLLSPISIFCWCTDVWSFAKELFCCRSANPPSVGYFANGYNKSANGMPGVMTLVVTPEGLQLKLPSSGLSDTSRYTQTLTVPPPRPYEDRIQEIYPEEETDHAFRDDEMSKLESPPPDREPESQLANDHTENSPTTETQNRIKPPTKRKVKQTTKVGGVDVDRGKKRMVANAKRPK